METYMQMLGRLAKSASREAAKLGTKAKNRGLLAVANELVEERELILQENAKDIEAAKAKGVKQSLIDRLALTEQRIEDMAEGLRQIAALDDPIGEVLGMKTRPNGLRIGKKRVPLGVVGIIYESRPNVTADAFGLCFKTGNAVILRGGSDAIHSNRAITRVIKEGLRKEKLSQDLILLVEDTSREVVNEMMKMHGWIDVLIPRGGAGLIANVVANSTVPVIETGTGNCHVYVDETADIKIATDIIENAKPAPTTKEETINMELRMLRRGMEGNDVRAAMLLMKDKGYYPDEIWSGDKLFGPKMEAGLRRMQADHDLGVDGILGAASWNFLLK